MLNRFLCLRLLSKNFKRNYNKKIKIRMGIMVTPNAKWAKHQRKHPILRRSIMMKIISFLNPVLIKFIIIIKEGLIHFLILFNSEKISLIKNSNKTILSSHKHDLITIYYCHFSNKRLNFHL